MTLQQIHEELPQYSVLFLREWIAQDHPNLPFGQCVTFPGSGRRTFKVNEERYRKWKKGEA